MNMLFLMEGCRDKGYADCGVLLLSGEPMEIILQKGLH